MLPLADSELMQAIQEGLAHLHTGDVLNGEELTDYLRRFGRSQ